MTAPLCFVLMPFGKKPGEGGATIDFDAVYRDVLKPGIEAAGMSPLRADEEQLGGIIHKPMFERLLLCEYAVADLTTANANVFYELGVRHAARPRSTVVVFAEGTRLPFDVAPLRGRPYHLSAAGTPAAAAADAASLRAGLEAARAAQQTADSPLYQLLQDFGPPDIARLKTDLFRARVDHGATVQTRIAAARATKGKGEAAKALKAVEAGSGRLEDAEAGVLVDLMLSYRGVKAWEEMIALVERMPAHVRTTVMVQEQYGLALNRAGRSVEAEKVLVDLVEKRGPSSETLGILGRVYKDRWEDAAKAGDGPRAQGALRQAIDAYTKGFEADWRDAYPGVNAVTLLEVSGRPTDLASQATLLPVVRYSVGRRLAKGAPDYWDHATRLELAVLAMDEAHAEIALADAIVKVREPFEPETTARNLGLIRVARAKRGVEVPWAEEAERALLREHDRRAGKGG